MQPQAPLPWRPFGDPRFDLRWRYPDPTPGGATVSRHTGERDDAIRVQLLSQPPGEVYFEVTRFADLAPAAEYERHREALTRERGALVGELHTFSQGTIKGWRYRFQLPTLVRIALLLHRGPTLYRIVYDPASALNQQILATVEWQT